MAKKRTPLKEQRRVTSVDVEIGQRIRAARLKKGISQEDLGKALGVSFQQIQKYEKGVNRVSSARLVEVAKAVDMTVEDFFDRVDTKKTAGAARFDQFMATREGVQIIEAMIELSPSHRQTVITLARSLAAA
jgi:transcriptional regulator with XRE-family HTH domain